MTEHDIAEEGTKGVSRGILMLLVSVASVAIVVGLALAATELRWLMRGAPRLPTLLAALVCFLIAIVGFLALGVSVGKARL